MKIRKKLLSTLLSLVLIVTLMLSIGSTTALAAIDDVDVRGNSIMDMMDRFVITWWNHFVPRMQCPVQNFTFVFVDSQLLEFGFLDWICAYMNQLYETNIFDDLGDVFAQTGFCFLVHQYDDVYLNISEQHYAAEHSDYIGFLGEGNYLLNLDNESHLYWLASRVGYSSMCGIGIWEFDGAMYQLMKNLRQAWDGNFKVYVIEREPIASGDDPLFVTIYNSANDSFGGESGATPGMGG